jgi:hypothetical protein
LQYETLSYMWGDPTPPHLSPLRRTRDLKLREISSEHFASCGILTTLDVSGLMPSVYKSIDTEQNTSET